MYVCLCRGVTDRAVKAAITSGAHTLDEVASRCQAGDRCGGCHPLIEDLLDELLPAEPRVEGPACVVSSRRMVGAGGNRARTP